VVNDISEGNVTSILEASYHMEVRHATEACTEFMLKQLDLDNCLEFWLSARLCGNERVLVEAIGLLGRHLDKVAKMPNYLSLQSNTVIEMLSDDKLQVPSEVQVYEAAMDWLKYEPEREADLSNMLDAIRLPLLPVNYLLDVVGKEDLIEENSNAMKTYSKALKSRLGGGGKNAKPRHNVVHGMRGGYEKMSKSMRMSLVKKPKAVVVKPPQPVASSKCAVMFQKCCNPEKDGDRGSSPDLLPEDQLVQLSSSVQAAVSNVGNGIQEVFSNLKASLKKASETVTNPETYNNLNKRQVGGYWLNVSTKDVDTSEFDIIEEEGEEKEIAAAEANEDAGDEAREEEEDDEANVEEELDAFDLLNHEDGEVLQQSFSLTEPLEDVAEVNEEDLVSEAASAPEFDMDGLSISTPVANADEEDEGNFQKGLTGGSFTFSSLEPVLDLKEEDENEAEDIMDLRNKYPKPPKKVEFDC